MNKGRKFSVHKRSKEKWKINSTFQINSIYVLRPGVAIAGLFYSLFKFKGQNANKIVYCNCNWSPSNIANFATFL